MPPKTSAEERCLMRLLWAAHHRMDQQPDRYPTRPAVNDRLCWELWKEQQCTR